MPSMLPYGPGLGAQNVGDGNGYSPATAADSNAVGTITWSSPSDALISDLGQCATATITTAATDASHYLKLTNFSAAIPAGETITGVKFQLNCHADAADAIYDNVVKLVVAGAVVGSNLAKASTDRWALTTATLREWGGETTLWGTTLTPAQVNASNFGFVISVKSLVDGKIGSVDGAWAVIYTSGSGVVFNLTAHGPVNQLTGVGLLNIPGTTVYDRVIRVDKTSAGYSGVPIGVYEHTSEDSNGNWVYSPVERNI